MGTPVIAATGSCLEEAGGKGGVYVDPDNVDQYIEEARVLLDSRYHCDKLVELGETDKYEPLCRHCFNKANPHLLP